MFYLKAMSVNWKTTGLGVAAILSSLANIVHDIATGVPWQAELTSPNVGTLLAGILGLFARDATVTSEQSGAK